MTRPKLRKNPPDAKISIKARLSRRPLYLSAWPDTWLFEQRWVETYRPPQLAASLHPLYPLHFEIEIYLCRVHEALRSTPAMALGIAERVWKIDDLLDAALAIQPIEPQTTAPDRRRRSE